MKFKPKIFTKAIKKTQETDLFSVFIFLSLLMKLESFVTITIIEMSSRM